MSEPMLACAGVVKTYRTGAREVRALRGVDLDVRTGEWLAVMGPSGCGKTTLLQLLGGLDRPDAGEVRVGGDVVSALSERRRAVLRRTRVGFVFQTSNLVSTLTVAENVEAPLVLSGVHRAQARERRTELLDSLGVSELARALPAELSGGEQQRVALARALANRPAVVLADEPTGSLDSDSARQVLAVLRECHDDGQTIVLVTHDHRVAAAADRVVLMADGRIREESNLTGAGADLLLAHLMPLEGAQ